MWPREENKWRKKKRDAAFLATQHSKIATTLWGLNIYLSFGIWHSLSLFNFIVWFFFFFASPCAALIARFMCLHNCFSSRKDPSARTQYTTVINWLINSPTRICGRISETETFFTIVWLCLMESLPQRNFFFRSLQLPVTLCVYEWGNLSIFNGFCHTFGAHCSLCMHGYSIVSMVSHVSRFTFTAMCNSHRHTVSVDQMTQSPLHTSISTVPSLWMILMH